MEFDASKQARQGLSCQTMRIPIAYNEQRKNSIQLEANFIFHKNIEIITCAVSAARSFCGRVLKYIFRILGLRAGKTGGKL